jgi:hypothetical protein
MQKLHLLFIIECGRQELNHPHHNISSEKMLLSNKVEYCYIH